MSGAGEGGGRPSGSVDTADALADKALRYIGREHTLSEEQARGVACGGEHHTSEGGGAGLPVGRVCDAGAPLRGEATSRGVQGGPGTHSNERKGAVRGDCDAKGVPELCAGADVVVVEASNAAAGEGGGRSGGAHAQFSQTATPVEVGLRDEREACDPIVHSGLCTIGPPRLQSSWPWAQGLAYSSVQYVWAQGQGLDLGTIVRRLTHARRP